MEVTIPKLVSVVFALGYAVVLLFNLGARTAVEASLVLMLPLALIWFPEELGSMMGYVGGSGNIDTETPPGLVSFLGWSMLVGTPVVLYFIFGSAA